MRKSVGGLPLALTALLLAACSINTNDATGAAGSAGAGQSGSGGQGTAGQGAAGQGAGGQGAGGQNTAGAAGEGQAGAGGGAGAPGCPDKPACGGVGPLGDCVGNVLRTCIDPPFDPKGGSCPPVLSETDCGASATCVVEAQGAYCKPKTACQPGDARCKDDSTLERCRDDGSGFDAVPCPALTACKAAPKSQAKCEAASNEASAEQSLKGCVKFERRGMSKDGATDIKVDDAWYQFIAIYNGSNYIGSALTGPDGCFDTLLAEPATEQTTVYVYTIDFDGNNQPLIGLVHNTDPSLSKRSGESYWFWDNTGTNPCGIKQAKVAPAADGKATMETLTIPEACGSGAIRIFQWVRYAMLRLGPGSNVASTNARKQDSIAVFWEPGVKSDCGSCYLAKPNGMATVIPSPDTTDTYDSLAQFSGTDDYPSQWSYSVQSQIAGLWALSTYGRPTGEGGQHFLTEPSKPGIAFSFGWATAFAQRNVSVTADDATEGFQYDSLYVDTQAGTTFWVDLNKLEASSGTIKMPSTTQGIDQNINEFVVASAIWRLWQPQAAGEGAFRGLGDNKIFQALGSPRILDGTNRGYTTLDLVDYLDATRCIDVATADDVDAVAKHITFPWDASPTCN